MASDQQRVRTRICILSDTHNEHVPIPPCDLVIHCGDLTLVGLPGEYTSQFAMLRDAPAPLKLVIPGNHDISLDRSYYDRKGLDMHGPDKKLDAASLNDIRDLWCGSVAKDAGIVYLETTGMSRHVLGNGACVRIYSSAYTPEFCDWAFAYNRDQDLFNPTELSSTNVKGKGDKTTMCSPYGEAQELEQRVKPSLMRSSSLIESDDIHPGAQIIPDYPLVDLVMTHGPPLGILDQLDNGVSVGCEYLRQAIARARPLLHCFGHIHEGWGSGKMNWDTNAFTAYESQTRRNGSSSSESPTTRPSARKDIGLSSQYEYLNISSKPPVTSTESSERVKVDCNESSQPVIRGHESIFVNASIMNVRYQPTNKPWVVDLDLPSAVGGNA